MKQMSTCPILHVYNNMLVHVYIQYAVFKILHIAYNEDKVGGRESDKCCCRYSNREVPQTGPQRSIDHSTIYQQEDYRLLTLGLLNL